MKIEELWDEITDEHEEPENPNYEVVVETDQGTERVKELRWEHQAKRVVIELD